MMCCFSGEKDRRTGRPSEEGFRARVSWVADAGIKRDVCENGSFIDLHSACIGSRGVDGKCDGIQWQ